VPNDERVDESDRQQRRRASDVGSLDTLPALRSSKKLNAEADAEQETEQRIEAALDQPLLRERERAIERGGRVGGAVPVVEVRPEDAEHRPASEQVEGLDALARRYRLETSVGCRGVRGGERRVARCVDGRHDPSGKVDASILVR